MTVTSFSIASAPGVAPFVSIVLSDGQHVSKLLSKETLIRIIIDAAKAVEAIEATAEITHEGRTTDKHYD
ncbi:hypothetical protein [Paremcibacter congregatus]|uniref:hypothetical protein n=1 Tax=Paremcibacter congregatus TaxID=2043170 RepID=UPI0030EF94DB|tara:strand:- start:2794 stop:3003 length:210 start_codon:yes stop_codon:yes gene_type:complete